MIFERKQYLQKLISAEGNGMIKIVTGIRRCGKSFLLFNIFHNYLLKQGVMQDHIIELAMDDKRNRKLCTTTTPMVACRWFRNSEHLKRRSSTSTTWPPPSIFATSSTATGFRTRLV